MKPFLSYQILIFFFIIIILLNSQNNPNIININNYFNYSANYFIIDNLTFNITNINSYFSYNFKLAKISFSIQIFDADKNLILPSDLTLFYNLHILCFLKKRDIINIYSLANIEDDKFFKCTEFYNLNENIKTGVIIYEMNNFGFINPDYKLFYLDKRLFNSFSESNDIFNTSILTDKYLYTLNQIQNENNFIESKKLKKLYISKPYGILKRNIFTKNNGWYFFNIYNEYFCFCSDKNCLKIKISKKCKYFFYLYLIDTNKNVYEKNEYLLLDFILKNYSSDDAFPIFEKMINENITAHYLTADENIYEKYCYHKKKCDIIIHVEDNNYKINDEFLEKYLTLILKLNKVISSVGVNINFINNLFYNIDYITYICLGHGVSYFKYYLYKDYYGPNNFDKLLIPNSNILISCAIKYGWKDENLIKLNLPKWDKYNKVGNHTLNNKGNIEANSIFIMFTWREIKTFQNIGLHYIKNIINLLNNDKLINKIKENNLTLYFSIHHKFLKYKDNFSTNSNVKYLEERYISECLSLTNLIVTDYSSIIFDIIYRRKPYIIFIPDIYAPEIKMSYKKISYNVIKKFKYNHFPFENIYFDIDSVINKINYYIDNRFKLDKKSIELYDEFNFKRINTTNEFIHYLIK